MDTPRDIDALVGRAAAGIGRIAGKVAKYSAVTLALATVVCIGSLLLGIAALSGGIETVWIVLAIVFAAIAIGGPLVALWRALSARRHAPEILSEVRALATGRPDGREVIETFVVEEDGQSTVVLARRTSGLGGAARSAPGQAPRLAAATSGLAAFPFQILVTLIVTSVFGFLGLIFLIALAL